MEILFVAPDYYSDRPKPCMNGWGTRFITVNPIGDVLPCPTAGEIEGLRFDNVRDHPLGWIWTESEAFNRFRGTAWMPNPCRECEFREVDFGGCRCQAALITGNPAATDPACSLSPYRDKLTQFVESINAFPRRLAPQPRPDDWVDNPGREARRLIRLENRRSTRPTRVTRGSSTASTPSAPTGRSG